MAEIKPLKGLLIGNNIYSQIDDTVEADPQLTWSGQKITQRAYLKPAEIIEDIISSSSNTLDLSNTLPRMEISIQITNTPEIPMTHNSYYTPDGDIFTTSANSAYMRTTYLIPIPIINNILPTSLYVNRTTLPGQSPSFTFYNSNQEFQHAISLKDIRGSIPIESDDAYCGISWPDNNNKTGTFPYEDLFFTYNNNTILAAARLEFSNLIENQEYKVHMNCLYDFIGEIPSSAESKTIIDYIAETDQNIRKIIGNGFSESETISEQLGLIKESVISIESDLTSIEGNITSIDSSVRDHTASISEINEAIDSIQNIIGSEPSADFENKTLWEVLEELSNRIAALENYHPAEEPETPDQQDHIT